MSVYDSQFQKLLQNMEPEISRNPKKSSLEKVMFPHFEPQPETAGNQAIWKSMFLSNKFMFVNYGDYHLSSRFFWLLLLSFLWGAMAKLYSLLTVSVTFPSHTNCNIF